jgi:signal transduction histidine kinase
MQDREMRLNRLLVQLREISPEAIDEPLCQNIIRTDLVVLLRQVIEQRVPLCPNSIFHVNMPARSLFVRCDPFWMKVLLEHMFLNYMLVRRADTIPVEIHLEAFPNPKDRKAKITLRIRGDLSGPPPGREGEFEARIRELEQGEVEICLALCHQILHEHGGQIWSEQEGSISLTLPLAE